MNHVYRLVWNRAKRVLQVASELAGGGAGRSNGGMIAPTMRPLALACATLLGTGFALAAAPASAGDVTSAGDIILSGDIVEPGNVSYISTGGNIFQSDPANDSLTVAGNALFGSGNYIDVSGAGNDFHGLVSLQGNAATINDANALQLSISTIIHDLTVTSHGALDLGDALVGGSLTAHSNGGAITGGPLSIIDNSTIDAGIGDITLTDAGNDFMGVVTATGNDIAITDSNDLTTGVLTATGAGGITLDAGGALVATDTISTAGGAVSLTAAGNVNTNGISTNGGNITLTSNGGALAANGVLDGGSVSLTSSDGLTLNADVTATGTLTLRSVNAGIAQIAGSLIVNGDTSATAAGAITLTDFGNDFLGAVNLSAGGIAQITDANALALGSVNTKGLVATNFGALNLGGGLIDGNLSATSNGGAISQSGALTVTGTSTIDAGSGDITLTNANNDFVGAVGLTGNNVRVTDKNDLTISALANGSDGDVSLIAGGVLTLPGAIATTDDITLASNGGALTTAGSLSGNDVSLAGRDGVTLQSDITATGTLNLVSNSGGISQVGGSILAGGNSNIAGGSGAVNLISAGNDFVGTVNLSGGTTQITDANALTLGTLATGNLTANSAGALNLGTGTIGGNLSATSNGGAISQSGALIVTGTSNLDAGVGNITLTDTGNDFGGAVVLTGSNVSINDKNALSLGALSTGALTANSHGTLNLGTGTIGGSLSANSNNGAISQSGALTVTGTSNIDAGIGNITLTNAGNDFGGAVVLTGSNVTINDKNVLSLGALATGNLTATSTGALNLGTGTIGGNLGANSNNGAISQSGALTVTGTSNIDAGVGNIALTNAGNDFGGAVDLTGGATQITDANALTLGILNTGALIATSHGALNLGTGSIGGDLSGTSNNGAISQSGALTVIGSSSFNAGAGNIDLTNTNNDFQGTIGASGGNIAISDANTLALAAISGSNATITAGGDITMSGDASATGTFDLASNGGNITQIAGTLTAATLTGSSAGATTLDNINQIATLGDFSANGFSLTDMQALAITGTLASSGDIHLHDDFGITVTGAIDAGGTTTLGATTTLLFTGNATLGGDLVNDTNVTFDQDIDNLYAGGMSGNGALDKLGSGALVLDGDSSAFAGTTDVQAGTLIVGGDAGNGAALGGDVSVAANATLGGHGEIGGNVDIAGGAHLAPGNSIGTLTVGGNLALAQNALLDYEFGTPGADFSTSGNGDSVVVGGNLTLNGAVLNITDAGGMGPGLYTLFSYGGTLTETNGGIVFGATPTGSTLSIQNLTGDKRINLLDTSNETLNFWNGNGLASATQMGGGDGTWSTTSTNWTNADASVTAAMQPQPGFAIFGGVAGTVTIDNGSGAVAATGLQFASDGYVLDGDALTLVADGGATPTIRVGDGSAAGSGMTATIDSVLAGSDGVTKSDLGTLVLTADNTFSGMLGIDGGTLSVTRDANLGDAGNALALDGGVLRITGTTFQSTTRDVSLGANGGGFDIADAGNVFILSQSLSGSGAFAKSGAGSLVFTGNNTYTGGTTISAGTLQVGSGGTSGSIAGDVANNGTLAFDRSDAVTFAGAISGTGSLHQIGSGSTILTGANSYTGGTVIDAGTLQIGDGGTSGSIAGDVTDNGTLAFDRGDAVIFAGAISGNGSLQQSGGGTLVLDGDSSAFAGSTDVQSGTLLVGSVAGNGAALGGDVMVSTNATLGGHGEIGGNVVNAGTLAPGASIGTLTIHGDYTQTADGILEVDVAPDGQSDLLAVDGSATLAGGTVVVAIDGDWKPRTDYTILTADGGVDGSFDSAASNLTFLDVVLDYTADSVLLSLQRNDVAFASFAGTRNQRATAAAADTLGWQSSVYNALTMIGAEEAPQAFDALSGEIHASTRTALMDDSHYLRDAIGNRLLAASGNGGWISGWRHWTHADGDGNAAALRGDGNGFAAGVDFAVGGNGRLGAVVGAEQTDVDASARASSADIDSRHFGVYASLDADGMLLQAGAARSSHDIDARRTAAFSGFTDSLRASYDANTTQAFVDASRAFAIGRGNVSPFLDLAWVRVHSDGFEEDGGDAALQVDGADSKRSFATLGMRWNTALGSGDAWRLRGSVGWSHAFGGDDAPVDSQRFLGGSDAFEIAGTPIADNAFALDAGLRWQATPRLTVDADYVGRFASDLRDQGARVTLQIAF
jgi:outer membrane autotransporter protein